MCKEQKKERKKASNIQIGQELFLKPKYTKRNRFLKNIKIINISSIRFRCFQILNHKFKIRNQGFCTFQMILTVYLEVISWITIVQYVPK